MDRKTKNRGQSLVEYVLILAVVVTVIMIAMLGQFQSKVSNMYNDVGNAMPAETGS
jgi:Flp pilus assembly pilin Flp